MEGNNQLLKPEYATVLPQQGSLGGTRHWEVEARTQGQGHALSDLEPPAQLEDFPFKLWLAQASALRPKAKVARIAAP